ncbi:hypothetical protein B7463_g8052, partial [Scytalidium lignicola]
MRVVEVIIDDLIYKRGQAGVTKASVTIVFDNRDKKKSPIGFEEYAQISVTRQIVLGGTSKYLINGHRAQQQTVQNLFQSVQLNINNPNFLIMQGRITKVLNMKAVEILAMIEEAAGTRMFEDRRDKAFKTMAKKEMKVQEITELLRDEIDPKLEKLRMEKRAFLDFQQTQNDLERLTRVVVAHDYIRTQEKLQQSATDLEAKKQRMKDLEESAIRLKSEIGHLEEDIERVKAQRDKELRKGSRAQALEGEVKQHSNELVRLSTVLDLKNTSMVEEKDRKLSIKKTVAELEASLNQKKEKKQTEEAETKEELLQTLQTGVASKEGQESGYQGQLLDARNRANAAATEQEQTKLKLTHLEKRIKEVEPRAKKAKEANAGLFNELEGLRGEARKLEKTLADLGFEPGKEDELYKQESTLQNRIRELRRDCDGLRRKVANIDFNYSDPAPGFDRSKVKGLVAQLFTLDDNHTNAGTALEICAGGRLYNVVVDTEVTGTQLLQKGKLRKRVTIIPLNKISTFRASAQKIGAAQKIAPGKVNLALSLVGYDEEVTAAMEYVFGNTLICEDAETAKKVTFDPAVRMKSITLEGDSYDPSGTLSGGSAPNSSGVLVTLQKLNALVKELEEQERILADLQALIAREKKKLDQARKIKQQLDIKAHEIKLREEQIGSNSSSSIIQEVENTKATIAQLKTDLENAKARQAEANKDIKRIEKDMKDFNANKDGKLVELQNSLDALRKTLNKNSSSVKVLQKELQGVQVDLEQVGGDLAAAQEQFQEVEQTMKSQEEEIKGLLSEKARLKDTLDIAQAHLNDERAKLTGFDDELRAVEEASRSKASRITEEGLEMQKLAHQLEKFNKEQQAAAQTAAHMEKEHDWILDEKDNFGRAGTPYDFKGQNIAECKSSLRNLTERSQSMRKKINPKVMNMIDSVEKKEVSLKNMMKTVIRDKKKIEETIVSLDEYKKKALQETWQKVNHDFGQIFAELLPGSFAKLDPPEGKTINDGLEVKVSLGKVWKQSLTELSGGQRSLIAISLIMALLQFKPAPMYILDEVDAALDLSHTQNIGRLIKTRFKGSQFIVVSLKDGMFQNANRIFRTRFSEGTSVVQALTAADFKTRKPFSTFFERQHTFYASIFYTMYTFNDYQILLSWFRFRETPMAKYGVTLLALCAAPVVLLAIHERNQAVVRSKHTKGCKKLGIKAGSNLANQFDNQFPAGHGENSEDASRGRWRVQSLWIYPVKSCQGVELDQGMVIPIGMEYDRLFTFAQLRESVNEEDQASSKWAFITQREYALLATVKAEIWVPDQTSSAYDPCAEQVQSNGVIILSFPWRQPGWYGTLVSWAFSVIGSTAQKQFYIPLSPDPAQIQKAGYTHEQVRIWKDTMTALNMGMHIPQELSLYLGMKHKLGLFRIDDANLREVYRCAPRKEEIGYQPITGFQDAYPLHIISLASIRDVERQMSNAKGVPRLSAERFRANIILSGPDPYEEDTWKRIEIGAYEYDVSCRTARCKMPNVNQITGERHASEPDRTLRSFRSVDVGAGPNIGCLGMQMVPISQKSIMKVGDKINVLKTGNHVYIKL